MGSDMTVCDVSEDVSEGFDTSRGFVVIDGSESSDISGGSISSEGGCVGSDGSEGCDACGGMGVSDGSESSEVCVSTVLCDTSHTGVLKMH